MRWEISQNGRTNYDALISDIDVWIKCTGVAYDMIPLLTAQTSKVYSSSVDGKQNAVDGSLLTFWGAPATQNQWFSIVFDQVYEVEKIEVEWVEDSNGGVPAAWTMSRSTDTLSWVELGRWG